MGDGRLLALVVADALVVTLLLAVSVESVAGAAPSMDDAAAALPVAVVESVASKTSI